MMELISQHDLRFAGKGIFAKMLSASLMHLLGLHAINRLYHAAATAKTPFAQAALNHLQITYALEDRARQIIPSSGGCILIANHPTGALDGIVLIDALSRLRPDVRFMGNFLLDRISPLKRYFINVDPFEGSSRNNTAGIRSALQHLDQGGLLVIFPAGEVASWQHGFRQIADRSWPQSILRFIRKADVPVIPLWIEARNSMLFRLVGKIHPLLRTALLPRELLNKRGVHIPLRIGTPLLPNKTRSLSLEAYGALLRLNTDVLQPLPPQKQPQPKQPHELSINADAAIAEGHTASQLAEEVAALAPSYQLLQYGEFQLYCTPPEAIPHLMHEIGRQREITFREIGEGTLQALDTDLYDRYYHQLFLWDRAENRLVGAYRLGLGDEIMQRHGLKGFYTYSLFRMDKAMGEVMAQTIELGRSFIVQAYQRKPAPLMLLWKGLLLMLLRNEQYRYLTGPVTISGEFSDRSKQLVADYLNTWHPDPEHAPLIHPRTGMDLCATLDTRPLAQLESIDWINKLVGDIEENRRSMPILIRKYLQVGCRVLAFNTDHDFCDGLDGLILLDLARVPETTVQMLSKEIKEVDVWKRFSRYHFSEERTEAPHS